MKLSSIFHFACLLVVTSLAMAGTLDTVLVPDQKIKTPEFHEGEELGPGVIEKEFIAQTPEKSAKVAALKKISGKPFTHLNSGLVKSNMTKPNTPERSIASFQEDARFSNEALIDVRVKDQKDREESLSLVRAAILRGEFGKEARQNLLHQK